MSVVILESTKIVGEIRVRDWCDLEWEGEKLRGEMSYSKDN